MHKLLILLIPAAGICLSSCVNEPTSYKNYGGNEATIWQRSPRYSVTPPQAQRYTETASASNETRRSSTEGYNTYTGINRYGSAPVPRPETNYEYEPPRLSAAGQGGGMVASSQPAGAPAQERRLAPGLSDPPAGGFERKETMGNNTDSLASTERNSAPAANSGFSHLPLALPVPGKSGYVTLPAPYTNSPEIDVRGIAPGTPVEIPDSNSPGSTIQFRVP